MGLVTFSARHSKYNFPNYAWNYSFISFCLLRYKECNPHHCYGEKNNILYVYFCCNVRPFNMGGQWILTHFLKSDSKGHSGNCSLPSCPVFKTRGFSLLRTKEALYMTSDTCSRSQRSPAEYLKRLPLYL